MVANNTNYLEVDGLKIQLRRPEFAAFLAWLIPGAGHYYQGRYGKAAMYCVSILSLFVIGMVLGAVKSFTGHGNPRTDVTTTYARSE